MTDYVYKQKNLIYWIVFLISLSELDTLVEGLRYIKYAILPLSILFLFQSAYLNINMRLAPLKAFSFLLVYSIIVLIVHGFKISNLGLKDWLFIACYVIPLLAFFNHEVCIEKLFKIFVFFTFVSFFGVDAKDFSIESSSAPFEGASCFVFGAFAYYFFLTRSLWFFIISVFLMFLTLKRIALVGFCIISVLHFLLQLKLDKKNLLRIIKFSFLFFLILMFSLASGLLDSFIYEVTGKTANWFTLGRSSHYMGLFEQINNNPMSLFVGNGLGSSYAYAAVYYDAEEYRDVVNLHSDILKIAFELGVVFYLYFFSFICKGLSVKSSLLILYFAVIFLTDNILIYTGPMFLILTIALKINFLEYKGVLR